MAVILNIDTSTSVCSAALTAEGGVLCHREDFEGRNHAAVLSGFIKACLDRLAELGLNLDAVAVSMGPGSYTGLRIGLSEAKGLAYGLGVPMIGVDTLELLAVSVMFSGRDIDPDTLLVPMIDARRMEVFTAVYDMALQPVMPPQPLVLAPDSYAGVLSGRPALLFGDGSPKASGVITTPGLEFVADVHPLAVDMLALAERAWSQRQFIDTAYSTPWYRKEFFTTARKCN